MQLQIRDWVFLLQSNSFIALQAFDMYHKALNLEPENIRILHALAQLYKQQREFEVVYLRLNFFIKTIHLMQIIK